MSRFQALFHKELLRFWKVAVQTVAAPVLTAVLDLLVVAHALEGRVRVYDSVPYTDFLVPGLVMMSVLQNAFANSSSSLVQSKITGNIVFVLLAPISWLEFFAAYVLASVVRLASASSACALTSSWRPTASGTRSISSSSRSGCSAVGSPAESRMSADRISSAVLWRAQPSSVVPSVSSGSCSTYR